MKTKTRKETKETFTEFLRRVAGDYRESSGGDSPTADDLDMAAQRIEDLQKDLANVCKGVLALADSDLNDLNTLVIREIHTRNLGQRYQHLRESFKVETACMGGSWDDCWTEDDKPLRFGSELEAKESIREHIQDCKEAVRRGDMSSAPRMSDFRIVPA